MNHTTIDTPAGPLTIAVTEPGVVCRAVFSSADHALFRESTYQADLGDVSKAVYAYLEGDLSVLDEVAVRPQPAGEFHTEVRRVLRSVPPGRPITYTALAAQTGRPSAVRAAANACARNDVALFVPCHRVIRGDGGLGGYLWGLDVKRWLLEHEGLAPGRI
ncbi:methylated-DNA--[protein]-cysteine S-methyltransferase [Natronosporangium hydrolyticum]|uniref:methylated-DNA--[protein]-cysteine S-methyltransferase n=1 Tax=Natronosporangium hydrolyticum TaxID=2811111 RepID=A0A895YH74_9ACTN|nr:methylated-DNA--[protein]-cysteine S-methyltransferase [Natronosporangium hydrolyticum]QSB13876.1 methylated-DNA--[protein]-cysteine S-methyltransferase [Natronosporangium hydrolyticum]